MKGAIHKWRPMICLDFWSPIPNRSIICYTYTMAFNDSLKPLPPSFPKGRHLWTAPNSAWLINFDQKQDDENMFNDSSQPQLKLEKLKLENVVEPQIAGNSLKENVEPKPKKRIRKKPDFQHCFICGLRCRYLNRHIQIMHSNDTKYECDICKTYSARSKGQLYLHMGAKHINNVKT